MESRWINPLAMNRYTTDSLRSGDDRFDKDVTGTWSLRPQENRRRLAAMRAKKRRKDCKMACFTGVIIFQFFIAACVGFLVWSSVDTSNKLSPRTGTPCDIEPCKNGGVCLEGSNGFICYCDEAWSGKTCETDVDECKSSPCGEQGTCTNTVGSFTCACNDGYDSNNGCKDVDECLEQPCPPNADCENTDGGFRCMCGNYPVEPSGRCTLTARPPDQTGGQPHLTTGPPQVTTRPLHLTTGPSQVTAGPPQLTVRPTNALVYETGWSLGDSIVNSNWSAGAAGDTITGDCNQPDYFPFNVTNICGDRNVGQAITNVGTHSGSYSWQYKRGVGNTYGSGTPFSPGLNVKVGRSDGSYTGDADSFYASFWFKAAKDYTNLIGDGSRILVAAGDPDGTEPSSNYLEIYFQNGYRKKISVRSRESYPSYDDCADSKDCGDDYGLIYTTVAEDLDPLEWHHVEMTLHAKSEDYKDEWSYKVNGVPSTHTHGAYFKTKQYDEGTYLYVNRLNFAAMHQPQVDIKGFFFDDIYYKAFNRNQPNNILDEYFTSFEQ